MRYPLALVLLLAGPCADAIAQAQQIPLPPFSSTFSNSSRTRGFYFQAPIAFVIDGLRVPDESNDGTQNVEVFVMSSAPPPYPTTATGGSVFYAAGAPSSQIIPTGGIIVQSGDYVGVLGACGTGTMLNSYAASGQQPSTVLGSPITLIRFLTQTNLNSSGGDQPYTTEPNGAISRVEVYVLPVAGYATTTRYGNGCNGVAMGALSGSRPVIGSTFNFEVSGIPTGSAGGVILVGNVRIQPPIDLTPIGMPNCVLQAGVIASRGFVASGSTYVFPLPLPSNVPAGLLLHGQAAVVTPGANPLGVSSTNGLELVIDQN